MHSLDHEDSTSNADDQPDVRYWEPGGVITSMSLAIGIALGTLSFFLFGLFYTLFGSTPTGGDLPFNWWILAALSVAILVFHQLIHASVALLHGASPRIDLDVVQLIFPVMYCRITGQHFSRAGYLVYALAPLATLSLLGMILMVIDDRAVMLIVPLAINTGLSTRDLWMAREVWRLPPESVVRGERDGLTLISAIADCD
jgi:hypothetical protein